MRDRNFFLKTAHQRKLVEFSQSWITRTLYGVEGVCMALACAYIARNARKHARGTPRKLKGFNDQDLGKVNQLLAILDKESFRKGVKNTFGATPKALEDTKSPTWMKDFEEFNKEGKNQPEEIQNRHLLIAAITNATSRQINAQNQTGLLGRLNGIQDMIENMTGLEFQGDQLSLNESVDQFWYVSDGGHGWAVVSRPSERKFKLFDPNHGIIHFNTASDLIEAAKDYGDTEANFMLLQ